MKWKYPKKELLRSQLLLFLLLLKYNVVHQWCISWKLWQIFNREIKLVVFSAFQNLENHCFVLFCQEIAQNIVDSWWVSGADQQYNECILLKFEIWDGSHLLLINSAILSVNFFMFTFKAIFSLFFHVFHKTLHT